jgi:integrase
MNYRTISDYDMRSIITALNNPRQGVTDFVAARMQAVFYLLWGSALRLSEALGLNKDQVVTNPDADEPKIVKNGSFRPTQVGKNIGSQFLLPGAARFAIDRYLRLLKKKGWQSDNGWRGPLFITVRGQKGKKNHKRLTKRTAEKFWKQLQRRAGIEKPYSLHDLRHDAIARCPGSTGDKARLGRCSSETAAEHPPPRDEDTELILEERRRSDQRSRDLYIRLNGKDAYDQLCELLEKNGKTFDALFIRWEGTIDLASSRFVTSAELSLLKDGQ